MIRPSKILKIFTKKSNVKPSITLEKTFKTASKRLCKSLKVKKISGPLVIGRDISRKDFRKAFTPSVTEEEMRLNAKVLEDAAKNHPYW